MNKDIYMYWNGPSKKLINIFRKILSIHSENGENYKIHLIGPNNINDYIKELPDCFYNLRYAHQADYVRVNVIYERGGLWMDSDILVMNNLNDIFAIFDEYDGFFLLENNKFLTNCVFGSRAGTDLMKKWKESIDKILSHKKENISWTEIGTLTLIDIYNSDSDLYKNYKLIKGLDNVYPINWDKCVEGYINKPFDYYKHIIRDFQPFLVLVNDAYNSLEEKSYNEILQLECPLNYFIKKSLGLTGKDLEINQGFDKVEEILKDVINDENLGSDEKRKKFEKIYENCIWTSGDNNLPLSGPGSAIKYTHEIIHLLDYFSNVNKIKSVVDLGCGDLTWMSKTELFNSDDISYTGIDIVSSLIDSHKINYPMKNFVRGDIITIDFDVTDLCIIRDVIFHMSMRDIKYLFEHIKGRFKYICITSCLNNENNDIFDRWYYSPRNINIEPFNICKKYITSIYEEKFNRLFCIFEHDVFYE